MPGWPYSLTCELTTDGASVGSPTWTDITDRLVGFTCQRGQQYDTDGPQPGTLEVRLDNTDGEFDPDNSSSALYGGLKPNRRVRIIAQETSGSSPVPLAYGFVDRIERTWPNGSAYSETTLSCTDLTKFYARRRNSGLVVAQSGADDHMDAVVVSSASVGGSGLTFAAATYTGVEWDFITALAIADGGFFFIGGDGSPVYHTSTYRSSQSASTSSQATFAYGTPEGVAVEIDLAPYLDDKLLANSIGVVDKDGTNHTATDAGSITQYGTLPYSLDSRDGLPTGGGLIGSAATSRANALLAQRAHPTTRVDALTLDALTDDDCLHEALERQISDRITLLIGPMGGGAATTQGYFINSVGHEVQVAVSPTWRTSWQVVAIAGTLDAYEPEPPDPDPGGTPITDTFNRANGSGGFTSRSDGGTWDLTANAAGRWYIEGNQAIKQTEGGTPETEWVSADYGDINEVAAEIVVTWTGERFYEKASIYLGVTNDPGIAGDGSYFLNFEAIEGYFQIGKNDGITTTAWAGGVGTTSTWGTGPRTLKLTFNKSTGLVRAYFDGALVLSHTDSSPLTGTRFAFNYEDERVYLIDSINVGPA